MCGSTPDDAIDLCGVTTPMVKAMPGHDDTEICRPALARPACGNPRCVAICVCISGVKWAYEDADDGDAFKIPGDEYDDDDDDSNTVVDDTDEEETSLWEAIDALTDFESDDEGRDADADCQPKVHTFTSPPSLLLPPRKRALPPANPLPDPLQRPIKRAIPIGASGLGIFGKFGPTPAGEHVFQGLFA